MVQRTIGPTAIDPSATGYEHLRHRQDVRLSTRRQLALPAARNIVVTHKRSDVQFQLVYDLPPPTAEGCGYRGEFLPFRAKLA